MSEQVKKYPKPEEQEAIDHIMEMANQWCNMDKNGGRGAMVMLTDERGTHYQFVGNQERNTRAAVDILTADDMKSAGRTEHLGNRGLRRAQGSRKQAARVHGSD